MARARDRRQATLIAQAHERLSMRLLADGNPLPRPLGDFDAHPSHGFVTLEKPRGQRQRERFDVSAGMLSCKCVHGVLHGVGRQHRGVVAQDVRGLEVALEADVDQQILHVVTIATPRQLQEPDARLTVCVVGERMEHDQLPRYVE